jgi:hypothetical protein
MLLCVIESYAASGAAERARAFAHLPNWTGQWEIVGVTPSASGGFEPLDAAELEQRKWGPPPYKPEAQVAFDKLVADGRRFGLALVQGGEVQGLRPTCTFGFPRLMIFSPLMFEILTTPEETAMIFSGRETRHIYTDGRPHTAKDELWPTYWGDSIGHWEGQTLVIDTIAVTRAPFILPLGGDGPLIVGIGSDGPALVAELSPEARYIERIRMLDPDHLEDQMTIIDPINFTAPWHIGRNYHRLTHLHRMVHEDCEGEDRNPVVNGNFTLTPLLTSPGPH